MRLKTESRYPSGPNGERLPAYDVVTGCEVHGSLGQAENVANNIRRTMQPAEQRDIEAWLAELSVIVAKRADDEFSETLRLESYASRLRQYPADVAKSALLDRTWKFWPAWEELEKVCEALTSPRKAMLSALQNPQKEPEPQEPRVTAEKAADILSKAGFTAKRAAAVNRAPMAKSMQEAEEKAESKRVPHWTEGADPDGPEMQRLRKARAENKLMNPSKGDAA